MAVDTKSQRDANHTIAHKLVSRIVAAMAQLEQDGVSGSVGIRVPRNRGQWGNARLIVEKDCND